MLSKEIKEICHGIDIFVSETRHRSRPKIRRYKWVDITQRHYKAELLHPSLALFDELLKLRIDELTEKGVIK